MVLCNGFKNCVTPRTCNSKPLYKNHLDQKRFCNFSCISVEYCLVSKYNNQRCASCNEPQRYIFQGNDSTFGLSFPHRGSVSEKLVRGKDGFLYCSLGHPLRAVQVKKTIYRTAHLQIHFHSLDLLKPGFLATEGL